MKKPQITITYNGENGDGWVPKSQRDLWNYAVRTGQVVVPPALDDGGSYSGKPIDSGETVAVWTPPEYAGRLREAMPPPQPSYFEFTDESEAGA